MSLISKPTTFSSGATIVASEHNSNFDTIYDNYNGSITNANIDSSAAIVGSKLDLSAAGAIGGTTPSPGTFTDLTSTGDTILGNASGDDVTITGSIAASIPLKDETIDIGTTAIGLNDLHIGSGGIINWDGGDITLTHSANTLTWAGATTIDFGNTNMTNVDIDSGAIDGVTIGAASAPTVTDLGSVATCDINGGTMDGVNIGTTIATGELIVNDSSDNANGLGDQGNSAQVLTSAGAGADPTWETVAAQTSTSNVIFSWSGVDNANAAEIGIFTGAGTAPIGGSLAENLFLWTDSSTTTTLLNFQFTKIAGISTVTIHARLWAETTSGTEEAILTVDIGGQSNTVKSVTSTTPTWVTVATIDVSGLSNGTVYDGIVQLENETNNKAAMCSAVTLIAS